MFECYQYFDIGYFGKVPGLYIRQKIYSFWGETHSLSYNSSMDLLGAQLYLLYPCLLFQLAGLGILSIGVWAWSEKDTFNNLSRLANIALDPAFVLIITGNEPYFITYHKVELNMISCRNPS